MSGLKKCESRFSLSDWGMYQNLPGGVPLCTCEGISREERRPTTNAGDIFKLEFLAKYKDRKMASPPILCFPAGQHSGYPAASPSLQ